METQKEEQNYKIGKEYYLILVLVLLITYVMAGNALSKFKITFVHQSGIVILIGILFSKIYSGEFHFFSHGYQFLTLLLPPIILEFGWNLKKGKFIKNLWTILVFGVANTFLSFGFIILFTYIFGYYETKYLLLFAALVISDNTNVFSLIDKDTFPNLFNVLLGENALNYVSGIVLFEWTFLSQTEKNINILSALTSEIVSLIFAILAGFLIGLITTLILKKMQLLNFNQIAESITIIYCAYISYVIGGYIGTFEIISLFICGIILSKYAFVLLSDSAKQGTNQILAIMSTASQALIFVIVGFGSSQFGQSYDFTFIALCTFSIILSRLVSLFLCSLLLRLFLKQDFVLNCYQILIIWLSGTIRGAICLSLVETLPIEIERRQAGITSVWKSQRDFIVSTTIGVIILTNIIITAILPLCCKFWLAHGDQRQLAGILKQQLPKQVTQRSQNAQSLKRIQEQWKIFDQKIFQYLINREQARQQQEEDQNYSEANMETLKELKKPLIQDQESDEENKKFKKL